MTWPPEFHKVLQGEGCPMCEQGRPDDDGYGLRFFSGKYSDAQVQRLDFQRGYSIAVWRGRHVSEPTQLTDEEATGYLLEVLVAGPDREQAAPSNR